MSDSPSAGPKRAQHDHPTPARVGFGLAFATLIAVGIVQHRSIHALIRTESSVEHTRQVRTEPDGVCSAILQGGSGTRGYVVMGEQGHLKQQQTEIDRGGF